MGHSYAMTPWCRSSSLEPRGALVWLGGGAHHLQALCARDAHAGPLCLAKGLGSSRAARAVGQRYVWLPPRSGYALEWGRDLEQICKFQSVSLFLCAFMGTTNWGWVVPHFRMQTGRSRTLGGCRRPWRKHLVQRCHPLRPPLHGGAQLVGQRGTSEAAGGAPDRAPGASIASLRSTLIIDKIW